jgi:hypothetical protein
MPIHAVAGHLVIIFAPITALIAILYAASSPARSGLRWPLLAGAVVTAGLVVWAGEVGGDLLERIKTSGPASEVTAATIHAKDSDALSVAVFVLLAMVLLSVLRLLRPGRTGTGPRIAAILLALSAVAVLVTTWTSLSSALAAVWSHHPSWIG